MNDREQTFSSMPQTLAAARNFGWGFTPYPFLRALAEVKEATLRALQETEHPWSEEVYHIALSVLKDIREGLLNDLFPLDLAQGGAGTSLHMNICEVLAQEISRRLGKENMFHPLDDGARSQSTNDVVSTAAIIVIQRVIRTVEEGVIRLQEALVERERTWRGIPITGRTEYQDALPMDLAQVVAAWAGTVERDRWRLNKLKERSRTVPLGGTAVGTAAGASPAYVFVAERELRRITGLPIQRSQNLTDTIAQRDEMAEVAEGLGLVATNLIKLCRDLMFYSATVVGELRLPHLQWGSTAMPQKNNPVLLEFAMGLAIRCRYQAFTIVEYAASGHLQLNPFVPFMVAAFLSLQEDLVKALDALSLGLLPRLEVDIHRCRTNLLSSPALLNALRPLFPYEKLKVLEPPHRPEVNFPELHARLVSLASEAGVPLEELFRLVGLSQTDVEGLETTAQEGEPYGTI
ncbi:lyase family protein [Treponema sp. J25]|uniref:lyase family protein n=1 Tax=Treponema sp. J25 TaxID=2094121 RepID=UPI001043BEAF|nr:lyase family protein [Treponema sp. J25]TCW62294.1 fumarate lyase [Treponema sp. J25]